MTGFLLRLAGMALGQGAPGAARVALLPRFATPHAVADMPHGELSGDEPAARPEPPPAQPPRSSPEKVAAATVDRRPVLPMQRADAQVAPAPRADNGSSHLPRPIAGAVTATGRATAQDHAPRSVPAPRGIPSATGPAVPTRADPAAALPTAQPSAPPIAETPPASTPLSQAAVASRVSSPRDERPVIHVTIDRIDLRTPDVAKPDAASKPARRQPTISLADYLRRNGGGRR